MSNGNVFAGKKLAKEDAIDTDFVGGGGLFDSDIYLAKIKTAFTGKAANSEARNVTLLLDIGGRELRSQIWVSNKAGEVTYTDKQTKEVKNLPGFNQTNALALLVTGKNLGDLDAEDLVVKLYDFDAKKEIPQSVSCFTELHGETIAVAVQRQTVDKNEKNAAGDYVPSGETRDVNVVVKFLDAEKQLTISEIAEFIKSLGETFDNVVNDGNLLKAIKKAPAEQATYADKWLKMNKGKTYDNSAGKKGSTGKAFAGSGTTASAKADTSKAASSLFDD
jgi:hypothetical protein